MLEGFTGYLLPWDQTAYWATVVGININGTAPFLGPFLSDVLRGGNEIGTDTIARFYSIHMLLIPGALIALIGLHLYLVVRLGVTSPPWSKNAAGRDRPDVDTRKRGLVEPRAAERQRKARRMSTVQRGARRQSGWGTARATRTGPSSPATSRTSRSAESRSSLSRCSTTR